MIASNNDNQNLPMNSKISTSNNVLQFENEEGNDLHDHNEGAWGGAEARSRLFFENKEIFHPRNDNSQDDIPVIADVSSLFS